MGHSARVYGRARPECYVRLGVHRVTKTNGRSWGALRPIRPTAHPPNVFGPKGKVGAEVGATTTYRALPGAPECPLHALSQGHALDLDAGPSR